MAIREPLQADRTAPVPAPAVAGDPDRPRGLVRRPSLRALGLLLAVAALVFVCLASLAVGSRSIPLGMTVDALLSYDPEIQDQLIVRELRGPRTIIGLMAGAALGLSGALMQGLTRNPLGDPGILGITAGASLAAALAVYLLGAGDLYQYIWFAFAGAAVGSGMVYGIASMGREGPTPVKLAIAGVAVLALFTSLTTLILLRDIDTLDALRFWLVGSLAGRGLTVVEQAWPFIAVGVVLALACGRVLNALSLGEDVARSLGQKIGRARAVVGLAIVLLAGAATAAAGPIVFVGLVIPHLVRAITGPDYRWILPYCAVLAPILLIGADILGRVVARPGEVQVGIITALVGGPFFVALVRKRKLAEL